MKKGSPEWYGLVNKHHNFPCIVAFSLIKEPENIGIFSTVIYTKSKLENVKYNQCRMGTYESEGSALLSVKEINNAEEYFDETERLQAIWGYATKKAESVK